MTNTEVIQSITALADELKEKHGLKLCSINDFSPNSDGKGILSVDFNKKFTYDLPETPKA